MVLGLVVTRYEAEWTAVAGALLVGPSDRPMERALIGISPPPHNMAVPSADYADAYPHIDDPRSVLPVTRWTIETGAGRPWGRRTTVPSN